MPAHFVVTGGRPLHGTIRPAGNKNAALPVIAATLLADGPVELENIPRISDVETLLALLADLGAEVAGRRRTPSTIDTRGVRPKPLNPALCTRIRASILLAGPLLARFGAVACRRRAETSSAAAASTPISLPSSGSARRLPSVTAMRSRQASWSAPTSSSTSRASPAPRMR